MKMNFNLTKFTEEQINQIITTQKESAHDYGFAYAVVTINDDETLMTFEYKGVYVEPTMDVTFNERGFDDEIKITSPGIGYCPNIAKSENAILKRQERANPDLY